MLLNLINHAMSKMSEFFDSFLFKMFNIAQVFKLKIMQNMLICKNLDFVFSHD